MIFYIQSINSINKIIYFYTFKFYLKYIFILKIAEIYSKKYAPREFEVDNVKYNSSDDDLVSHISKRQPIRSNEFKVFLKVDHAHTLIDTLN